MNHYVEHTLIITVGESWDGILSAEPHSDSTTSPGEFIESCVSLKRIILIVYHM